MNQEATVPTGGDAARRGAASPLTVGVAAVLVGLAVVGGWAGGALSPDAGALPTDSATLAGVVERLETDGTPPIDSGAAAVAEAPGGLAGFYLETRPGSPLWAASEGSAARRDGLLETLDVLQDEGLDVRAFEDGRLHDAFARLDDEEVSVEERVRAELLGSTAFLEAARHLSDGQFDPDSVFDDWRVVTADEAGAEQLRRVALGESPSEVFSALRPELPWYGPTVRALAEVRTVAVQGGWPTVQNETREALEVGDSSEVVAQVRERLLAGLSPAERALARQGEVPELFDSALAEAIAEFQERHGIAIDGKVGPETLDELNVSAQDRVGQLEIALERMRWLPDLGDRAIFVNVAGFELHVLEEARPVLSMDVVVGRASWPTVLFTDTMTNVVVNPYWHVPESIESREILPQVREDVGYLAEKNMVVVPASNNFGEPVDPASIDFEEWGAYDFRQEPGPHNALGTIKFRFPNAHNIYIHDTPAQSAFEQNQRALSHGCIRAADPQALASYVLGEVNGFSQAEIDDFFRSGERTRVDLGEEIPVHIFYLTAWADRDGVVHFHPDIYGLDTPLEKVVDADG